MMGMLLRPCTTGYDSSRYACLTLKLLIYQCLTFHFGQSRGGGGACPTVLVVGSSRDLVTDASWAECRDGTWSSARLDYIVKKVLAASPFTPAIVYMLLLRRKGCLQDHCRFQPRAM